MSAANEMTTKILKLLNLVSWENKKNKIVISNFSKSLQCNMSDRKYYHFYFSILNSDFFPFLKPSCQAKLTQLLMFRNLENYFFHYMEAIEIFVKNPQCENFIFSFVELIKCNLATELKISKKKQLKIKCKEKVMNVPVFLKNMKYFIKNDSPFSKHLSMIILSEFEKIITTIDCMETLEVIFSYIFKCI
jgi:hypothetical protein